MNNLKEVSRIEYFHDGYPFGFRNWTLKGYDENNNLICSVDKTDNNNYKKYVRFIIALQENGYKLRECDRLELKSGKQKFLLTQYLSKVTKEDIYKIGKIIGYTPRDIDNIKNVSEDEKEKFCHLVGFEPYEFERLCSIL